MRNSSTGIWANLDEGCSMTCKVEGSDMATMAIAGENHSLELVFNAEGLRRLAQASGTAVAEMDTLFEREDAARKAADFAVSAPALESA